MLRNISLFGLGLLLASCSTPEFRTEESICTATWMQKIPPSFEQEMYNQTLSRQVPTGQTSCTTTGDGNSEVTNCTQIMRTENYTAPAVRTVDINESRRNAQISLCTQQKCIQTYGNAECKS